MSLASAMRAIGVARQQHAQFFKAFADGGDGLGQVQVALGLGRRSPGRAPPRRARRCRRRGTRRRRAQSWRSSSAGHQHLDALGRVAQQQHGGGGSNGRGFALRSRKDLDPIVLVGTSPMVLATYAGSEYKTFADVVGAAKAKKNVSYGSIGSGSLGHLAMALLGKNGQMDWQHIPYKGGGPLMADAVAGHVPLSIGSVFLIKPHVDNKRVRPLAVTTSKRSPDLPDVPTMAESGFAGFDAPAWWAILAPARTPPEILRRMNEEINKALRNPEIARKLDAQGIDVVGGTPESARVFIERQMDIWAKVVKDNGIKAD
jgi:hypothetical protein